MSEMTLTIELRLLAYLALLSLLLWVPYILAGIKVHGLTRAVGYPSGRTEGLPDWAERAHRAHMNLVENLAPIAILLIVAHAMGISNALTVWGAHLIFWTRLVQIAGMYAGIPWVRTLSFAVGWVGCLMVFAAIMGAGGGEMAS